MTVFVGKVGQQLDVEGVVQHIVSPPGLKDTYPTDTGPRFFYKLKTDRGERVTLLSRKRDISIGDRVQASGKVFRHNTHFGETELSDLRSMTVLRSNPYATR